MKTVKIEMNHYYRDQFLDNPQLFETNLLEMFPHLHNYRVAIKKSDKHNYVLLTVVFEDDEEITHERTRLGRLV